MSDKGLYRNCIKRLLDIILSALALTVLSPLLLVTAFLVRVRLGSPVIFKQARPGKKEKIFYLYKFRSMTNEMGADGKLLPDAQRLTRFGKILRASSLDELPELVNILKGDMSIVGPRPLSIYYLPHYPAEYRRRHDVRPGLTGLAQVNGRNNLPWDDRFAMDVRYVDNLSFFMDLRIILDTVLKVLKRADVSVRGSAKVKDYGPYQILKEERAGGRKMADMTYSEIGSYFWLDDTESVAREDGAEWLPSMEDSCFTFSGRNAIDTVLRDILRNRTISKVCVPSYCCISMLQSFIDRGIRTEFYEVGWKDGAFTFQVPDADEHAIVLIMSYFGLAAEAERKVIGTVHEKGAVILEDITHSLLRKEPVSEISDYAIASLRKWFPVPTGGWAGKRKGKLAEKPSLDSNHAVADKISGMREKYDYLTGMIDTKENFLLTQAKFDNDLIHVDRMLKIDDLSRTIITGTDVDEVIRKRRRNAEVLLAGLQEFDGTVMNLPKVDTVSDTPLFLPVFMETRKRDALRRYLTERGIYFPIHWPEVMGARPDLQRRELSLICDQRYSEGDMLMITNTIKDWVQRTTESEER